MSIINFEENIKYEELKHNLISSFAKKWDENIVLFAKNEQINNLFNFLSFEDNNDLFNFEIKRLDYKEITIEITIKMKNTFIEALQKDKEKNYKHSIYLPFIIYSTPEKDYMIYKNTRISVILHDITLEDSDAITNAANEDLFHGAGVAGAITRKGGKTIQQESFEWTDKYGPVKTGENAYTSGGNLKCKYVIHAVGPIWSNGKSDEKKLLYHCVKNILKRTEELKLRSVSIPAISSGIFGFPKELCAKVFFDAIINYIDNEKQTDDLIHIRLTNFDQETVFF